MYNRKKTQKHREGLHVDKQYWGDIINYLKSTSTLLFLTTIKYMYNIKTNHITPFTR